MKRHPIALQLYSLRDMAAKDFVGALELTAELGYEGVEFAGYGGLSSAEMRDHLQRLNLKPVSSHVAFERLRDHLDEEIAYHRELGNDTLPQLYNLKEDIGETNNLYLENPEKLEELKNILEAEKSKF